MRFLSAILGYRRAGLAFALAFASGWILWTFNEHYPIRQWMLWPVLAKWAISALWALGCVSAGWRLLALLRSGTPVLGERLVLSFALGTLAFSFSVFVLGMAGVLGTVSFFALPVVFLALGAGPLFRTLRRGLRHRESIRLLPRATWVSFGALVIGTLGLAAVYVPTLTLHNIQHDARWYHLTIAQQYATQGSVAPFQEGWFLGAYPHLTSLLYAWCMLLPEGISQQLLLCAHLEVMVFLFTLASIPVMLRRVVPGVRLPFAWTAMFLFPGFLVYDSNLGTGADHIVALWAVGGFLALFRGWRRFGWTDAVLLAAMAGAAALTKYSATCIVVPLMLAAGIRVMKDIVRPPEGDRRLPALGRLLALPAIFMIVWMPHWLKNLLFFGDPLYPRLHAWLGARPWNPDAEHYFAAFLTTDIQRPEPGWESLWDTLQAMFTVGFKVHEYAFHGDIPTFGFLFAASSVALPFAAARGRTWTAFAMSIVGVGVWFWTNQRDRYLQGILPWMVVASVAVLWMAWHTNKRSVRAGVVVLVGAQLACGLGVFFLPSHVMIPGKHPLPHVIDLVEKGWEGKYDERFAPYAKWEFSSWAALGKSLPDDAKVLVHEDRLWLGLNAPVVVDEPAWQAGISYGQLGTPAAIHGKLRDLGVTHVVTGRNHPGGGDPSLAGEAAFLAYLSHFAREEGKEGKLTLWSLPEAAPPAAPAGKIAILTCKKAPKTGIYEVEDLPFASREPLGQPEPLGAFRRSDIDYVVLENNCKRRVPGGTAGFARVGVREGFTFLAKERVPAREP